MNLRNLFLGSRKSPLDPKVFERLALAAFLAWVGLGADGLSSSCYGPEGVFKELGPHRHLAPFLIAAIALTVGVLSWGYAFTIEAFPGGGGGYIVATQTLGRTPGLLCGCALLLDYVLTIAISMASGIEAIASFLPPAFRSDAVRLWATVGATLLLMFLNLRGVKESIQVLLPIFLGFLVTHTLAIAWSLVSHGNQVGATFTQAGAAASTLGLAASIPILMRAYTVGAGTYTGIEAISNTVPILKEPRVATAKRAMLYMAISLAFTSGGLLLGYLLYGVSKEQGKTLNASFLESLTAGTWMAGWFVPLTLLTEGALLFVAAQAGYVSGPRAVASMAVDSWVPRWFRRLSDQLTISRGILLIGLGAIAAVFLTAARVDVLMLIYAFSVFVTFVLSQLGMCVHQWRTREPGWGLRLAVNGAAFLLSANVAVAMVFYQPRYALWSGSLILLLMAAGVLIRLYYRRVGRLLGRLEGLRAQVESEPGTGRAPAPRDPAAPTAVILVRSYGGAGIHTIMTAIRLFPDYFRNFVFVTVGDIDFDRFKDPRDVERLRESVEGDLKEYVALVEKWGHFGECRYALGVDVVEETARLCPEIARDYPRALFFAGQLVFEQPGFLTRLLHEQTGEDIQRRLQFEGLTIIMLPIRVMRPRREGQNLLSR
jgi:amino acid transporter